MSRFIVAIPEQAARSYVISPAAIAFDVRRRFSTIIRDASSDLFLVPVSSMPTTNVFSAIGERFELAEIGNTASVDRLLKVLRGRGTNRVHLPRRPTPSSDAGHSGPKMGGVRHFVFGLTNQPSPR